MVPSLSTLYSEDVASHTVPDAVLQDHLPMHMTALEKNLLQDLVSLWLQCCSILIRILVLMIFCASKTANYWLCVGLIN